MEIKFIGKGKNKVQIELVGETHTFANAIVYELNEDSKVDNAVYQKPHPTMGNPILIVQTKSGDPVKVVKDACKRLSSRLAKIKI